MCTWLAGLGSLRSRITTAGGAIALLTLLGAASASAQENAAGEASLKLPDLSQVTFLGVNGHSCWRSAFYFASSGCFLGWPFIAG
jgi:hypothetical protein